MKLTSSLAAALLILTLFVVVGITVWKGDPASNLKEPAEVSGSIANDRTIAEDEFWQAPPDSEIPKGAEGELILYGRELITHTAAFLGPKGSIAQISNGLNCNNCHLDAGTKIFGNNYSAVQANYPKYRERSGSTETIAKRVNDCFERSLNGQALDTNSREMLAIKAYIQFLGKDLKKGSKPKGSGITQVAYLDRAADPILGKSVYQAKCQSCHQPDGSGLISEGQAEYLYPPLWGPNSYNNGAGLFRLSRFAGYVKSNMPLGVTHLNSQLSDEEAWDVAAYVNSMPRPSKDLSQDWPDISGKPIDHPFGPYHDGFSEQQHKYGPYKPIIDKRLKIASK